MGLFNEKELEKLLDPLVKEMVEERMAKIQKSPQKMFNRQQAAAYLGRSGSYIDAQAEKGYLTPTFPGDGKQRYYLREDLDRFAEEGKRYLKKA